MDSPASCDAGCIYIFLNFVRSLINPFALQFKAHPPERVKLVDFVN